MNESCIMNDMKKNIYILTLLFTTTALAESEVSYLVNSRFSFDLSTRTSYNDRVKEFTFQEFIGFDFHTFINYKGLDIGSIVLQPYLNRIDNGKSSPSFYDDNHDWEFIFRTLTFTYTGLGPQAPWIKLGHFELPFGLDHRKDTNGKLHQYSIARATGLKIDWGVSLGQDFENWYYEAALTRGSGVTYRDRNEPYAFIGRIAHDHDTWSAGLSYFSGEVLKNKTAKRIKTLAFDFEYYINSYGILSEIYIGQEDNEMFSGALLEFNWNSYDQLSTLYTQIFIKEHEINSTTSSIVFGGEYLLSQHFEASAQLNFSLSRFPERERQNVFEIQFRYRF